MIIKSNRTSTNCAVQSLLTNAHSSFVAAVFLNAVKVMGRELTDEEKYKLECQLNSPEVQQALYTTTCPSFSKGIVQMPNGDTDLEFKV